MEVAEETLGDTVILRQLRLMSLNQLVWITRRLEVAAGEEKVTILLHSLIRWSKSLNSWSSKLYSLIYSTPHLFGCNNWCLWHLSNFLFACLVTTASFLIELNTRKTNTFERMINLNYRIFSKRWNQKVNKSPWYAITSKRPPTHLHPRQQEVHKAAASRSVLKKSKLWLQSGHLPNQRKRQRPHCMHTRQRETPIWIYWRRLEIYNTHCKKMICSGINRLFSFDAL